MFQQNTLFFLETMIIACSYLYSHSQAGAQSVLAEVKQLYQAQVLEKEKMKQKLEENSKPLVKVCSLLHGSPTLSALVFTDGVGRSQISLLHLLCVRVFCLV